MTDTKRGTVEFYRVGKWYGDQDRPFVFRFKQPGLEYTAALSRAELDELLATIERRSH
jgi:hypothetical protein